MFIKINHFQLEIEGCLFCSNYSFICISYKLLSDTSSYYELISLFCKTYHLANCIEFFYVFNYYTLHFPAKLTGVMIFGFLVILQSFWCNTFRSGIFRRCSVYSYLKGIRKIWNIISMKYKSLENIKCARKQMVLGEKRKDVLWTYKHIDV